MPLDFGPSGFLGALGQGLRGAGGVLSKDVYDTQSEEGRLLATLQNRTQLLQQQAIIQGVENGSIDTRDPQVQQVLQRMGMPAMQPNAQVQQSQAGLRADSALRGRLSDVKDAPQSSDDLLKILMAGGGKDLTGPMGEKLLAVASQMQNREAMQEQRKRDYELRRDDLERRAEKDKRDSEDRNRSIDERAEASRRYDETKRQIAGMQDAARREGLALRRDLAGNKTDEKQAAAAAKLEKETAPVHDLVNEIDKAIRMIDANPGNISVTGIGGTLRRGKEFVSSTLSPGEETPATDFQSQILEVQSRWKKLPTVAANRFKSDADKIDNTVRGLGVFTSPTQARNSLVRLRDSLASGLENRGVEVPEGDKPDPTRGKIDEPKKISNDEEYAALPSGAVFIGPDGKRRKKP